MKNKININLNDIKEVKNALLENNKKIEKKQNKINNAISLDEFIENNDFWCALFPMSFGISMFGIMLALSSLSLGFSIAAALLFFGPISVKLVNNIVKKTNAASIQKLVKKGYFLEPILNNLETQEQKTKQEQKIKQEKTSQQSSKKRNIKKIVNKNFTKQNKEENLSL